MLEHGGQLRAAARHYGIAPEQWLDLSTGINPRGWPVPVLPPHVFQRLPEEEDDLEAAACAYYRAHRALPVAGTQAAIQLLPRLRPACRVGLLRPMYAEHARAWTRAGHAVDALSAAQIPARLPDLDVLVLCNPNNPSGEIFDAAMLQQWRARLRAGGWLIVDEAFMDTEDDAHSLAPQTYDEGLIVLRSPGKFFGLAGLRAGFVLAAPALLDALREAAGPWTVNHPARYIARLALRDAAWQQEARERLQQASLRLRALLTRHGLPPQGGCALFQYVPTPRAAALHKQFALAGILIRLWTEIPALRFGLPDTEEDWTRLHRALEQSP